MSVPVKIYRTVTYQEGQTPSNPNLSGDPVVNPINPNGGAAEELVPYDGAIKDVNLGEKGLSTGFVQYDNTPTDTPTGAGTVVWNPDKYTLDLSMGLGDSVQQIGMETYYTPVKNQTGSLIPDGTFVMATGSLGASGRITIAPAVTDGSVDSRYMLGVTTHDIADGEDGLVTWFGEIRGFNTNTKAPVGETWIDGTVLWNNPDVAGGFTSVEPQAPNLKIPVAKVISEGNNGVIFVRPRLGMRLTDLHDVDAFTPSDKDLISYDSALGHWNAKSLGSVIGGTSSQFLKGDGSLDSNSYALASSISGTTNYISKFTASGTIGNSAVFESGGNVGIGTSSPTSKLQVVGEFIRLVNVADTQNILLQADVSRVAILAPNGDLSFDTAGSERVRITSSGNVGIGTNAPTNTLDVNGTARIRTLSNATGDFVTASATGVLQKRTASEVLTDIGAIGGSGTTNYLSKFTASGTIGNSAVFESGGNVGIGTTSQIEKLTIADVGINALGVYRDADVNVVGTAGQLIYIGARNGTTFTAGAAIVGALDNPATTGFLDLQTRTSNSLTTKVRVSSLGNLLIGTTTDSGQRLQVNGDTYVSGNVGIGTSSPSAKLQSNSDSSFTVPITAFNTNNNFDLNPTVTQTVLRLFRNGKEDVTYSSSVDFGISRYENSGFSARTQMDIRLSNGNTSIPEVTVMSLRGNGNVGIGTTSPTNILDVNGTARVRTLTGTTGYLPLLSSTGVMGQSVAYNAGTGIVINGTFLPSGAVFSVNGVSFFNNFNTGSNYNLLSIDFGENKGFGYNSDTNEIFIANNTSSKIPVKIDTDAPTDSLVINASGNVSVGGQLHSPVLAKGNSSTAVTFNWNDGNIQTVTLTANCTFTFSNPQSGASYQIIITQDATGGRTITWPVGIYWEGKTIPALTGTANSRDIVTITYDGTNYNALIARNFGT